MKTLIRLLFIFTFCLITFIVWGKDPIVFQVQGIKSKAINKNVNNSLQTLKDTLEPPILRTSVLHFYRNGPKAIRKAMEPFGYFKPHIQSFISEKNGTWHTTFTINLGPAVTITKVDLLITGDGIKDPTYQKFVHDFPIKEGQTLNTEKYEEAKQKIFDMSSEHGYFQATMVESKIIVDLNKNEAKIIIHFNTGPRFHFGPSVISHTPFNDDFLRRYFAHQKGDRYDLNKLQKTQENLARSDFFRQVIVNPLSGDAIGLNVPINVHLVPLKKKQYIFGLGFGTDSGIRATAGVTYRWINSYGHRVSILLRPSQQNSSYTGYYNIPGAHPATDLYTFSAGKGSIDDASGKSNKTRVSFNYSTVDEYWHQTYALTYLNEDSRIDRFSKICPSFTTRVLFPSARLQYINTDQGLHPENGFSFGLFAAGANKIFSDASFLQVRANTKLLTTFKTHTRLLLRASYGHTDIEDLCQLPLSLQLLTGGARTVRGFSYNDIGPGTHLIVGSAEIQQRIKGDWYIGIFADAGNAAEKNLFSDLKVGVGLALIWLSPIGTIELSVAEAVSEVNRYHKIAFTMGPEF